MVAASTNIMAQSEPVRSPPRQHSSQYIPQRSCRCEPRRCSGTFVARASSRLLVSAAFDRDCGRCVLGPLSLRTGRVIGGVAGGCVIFNGREPEVRNSSPAVSLRRGRRADHTSSFGTTDKGGKPASIVCGADETAVKLRIVREDDAS